MSDDLVSRLERWQQHFSTMTNEELHFYRSTGGPRINLEAAGEIRNLRADNEALREENERLRQANIDGKMWVESARADMLKLEQQLEQFRWRKVGDEQPRELTYVLTFRPGPGQAIAWYDGVFWVGGEEKDVTHWREIGPPPEQDVTSERSSPGTTPPES